tara:strand:+ start:754 stop:1047 length:294 start_codon:yes stop_codon:yes gene_type:complete
MNKFKNITPQEAKDLLTTDNYLIDIRDEDSYSSSHIDGALNLGNLDIHEFIRTADKDMPTLIYCYKGISSQNAAEFLISEGFTEVYSIEGGYELWSK